MRIVKNNTESPDESDAEKRFRPGEESIDEETRDESNRCRKEMEIGISAEKKNLYLQTVEKKVTCELRGRSRSIMRLIAPTYTTHSKLAPGAIPFLVKEGK